MVFNLTNYRFPAEWEPHVATWLAWPHNPETWPGCLAEVQPVWAKMAAALSWGEQVQILIKDENILQNAKTLLASEKCQIKNIIFHKIPTNDSWMRDCGPVFMKGPQGKVLLNFEFNMWGGKYPPWDLDNDVPNQLSALLKLPKVDTGIILEGGSIEVNGQGVLLTTEQCLLNKNRNPQLNKTQIEDLLKKYLQVNDILWLPGGIEGDDTDGHIDDLARFVNETTILCVVEQDPQDENYKILQENLKILKSFKTSQGKPYEVIEIPMPKPIEYEGVGRLPASYANYYIGNSVVLAPIFKDPQDEKMISILKKFFPSREIVAIDARKMVVGLGAFHCVTQQEPF